jgi:UDP-N-acetylglucosamine--N-acetylmuramyl-(pentapeptide) pyrophosphoryl-undecaprenol N-acetylglucosamine transferase
VRPIVIAAGGTGGHLFPAEALAAELVARGRRVALMTDARTAETAFAGRERYVLSGAGIAGRGVLRAAAAVVAVVAGTIEARAILARIGAAAVVGFGGYPSLAPVLAAQLMRRRPPIVLHEQNAVLGRANRALARFADVLALSHALTTRVPAAAKTILTGNPVRPATLALVQRPYQPPVDEIRLLVLGGSLGARVFSDVVPPALALLPNALRGRLRVTQQCRAEDLDRVRRAYAASNIASDLAPFFGDVAERIERAHLIIARAGASTVAELAVAGRPSLLVPYPFATDDHQTANARALADASAAWLMPQPAFTPAALAHRLESLLTHTDSLTNAAARAASRGHADAAHRLADLVEEKIARESVA